MSKQADEFVRSVLSASHREHVDPSDLRELHDAFVRLKTLHGEWLAEPGEQAARRKAERCIAAKHALYGLINRVTMSEQIAAVLTRDA